LFSFDFELFCLVLTFKAFILLKLEHCIKFHTLLSYYSFDADMEDEPEVEESSKAGKGEKGKSSFVFPKEEDLNEEEFDRIMEERYKPGSGFLRYADDDIKDAIEMDALAPTSKDPPIWKVKCAVCQTKASSTYALSLYDYVLTSAHSIWFVPVDWTGEAIRFLSHAQIC